MSALHALLRSDLKTLLVTCVWLFVCLQYVAPYFILLPIALIPKFGVGLYRKITTMIDIPGRGALLCIPFSWCGARVHFQGMSALRALRDSGGSGLVLSTHCSRIDWLIGLWMGDHLGIRTGFVAEATIALLPLLGWSRFLMGDIFITRAFDKDRTRIEKNIQSFHRDGVRRLMFVAPEGFVADPGSKVGDEYIPKCDEFMKAEGRAPLTHLLTPRYKGMSVFHKHARDGVISVAMAYVEDAQFDGKGKLVGGTNASKGLRDPARTVPDLHSIFRGGLSVLIQGGKVTIGQDETKIKSQLLDDQAFKDAMLRRLDETGEFFDVQKMNDYYAGTVSPAEDLAISHLWLNLTLLGQTTISVGALTLGLRVTVLGACQYIVYVILGILCLHGGTHYAARLLTGVESRESICGETAIKAVIELVSSIHKPKKKQKAA